MKKIVLFRGGVETQGFFSEQIEKRLNELGHETFMFDYKKEASSSFNLLRFYERGNTVMLTFNFHGLCNEPLLRDDNDVYIWEELGIHCYNIVVDHPFYYDRFMFQLPPLYTQISIDKNHIDYMKRFYPWVDSDHFLPLGGTGYGDEKPLPIKERPIDLIMTGSWAEPEFYERYMSLEGAEYEEFYHRVLRRQLENPDKTFEEIFEPMISAEDENITDDALREAYSHLVCFDMYVRYYYRGEVIRLLAESGLKVVCIGGGWDKLPCSAPENIIHYGYCDSVECLHRLAGSKLSVNVMPWFKRGAHDRIFNSMLCGAMSLTDSSEYLDNILKDGRNCLLYSLNDLGAIADKTKAALKDTELLQSIADEGYALALKDHSWARRADELHALIEGC